MQGFQTPIQNDSFFVDEMGISLGTSHSERGLTYFEVALSGHMYVYFFVFFFSFCSGWFWLTIPLLFRIPQFSPAAAFQIMQFLMGFRDSPWAERGRCNECLDRTWHEWSLNIDGSCSEYINVINIMLTMTVVQNLNDEKFGILVVCTFGHSFEPSKSFSLILLRK